MNGINKLLEFQKKVSAITKSEINPYYKKKYFDINNLIEVIKPVLNESGLTITQPFEVFEGKNILHTYLKDGQDVIEHSSIVLPDNADPQKMGSAITYFRRYSIQSMLLLQAEDDDGNVASSKPIITEGITIADFSANPFKEMSEAKDLDTLKKVWTSNKPLQHDKTFQELKEKRKAELTEVVKVDDIIPEQTQPEPEHTDITKMKSFKTISGLDGYYHNYTSDNIWALYDEKYKTEFTEFYEKCRNNILKLNQTKTNAKTKK